MFTDEDLPPAPRFRVTKWLFSGLMAWSLFFGAIGGLAILMMADAFFDFKPGPAEHRELIEDNRVEEQVLAANRRISELEHQTRQIQREQRATESKAQPDAKLARVLIGLTQLKTAYDNDKSLQGGIDTLATTIENAEIDRTLADLSALTANNFPSKEQILNDLDALKAPNKKQNSPNQAAPELTWKERASQAMGQLVSVTPTKDIADKQVVARIEQAVAIGDFGLADKIAATLPDSPSVQLVRTRIKIRNQAQYLIQKTVGQISSAIGAPEKGSLY